MALFELKGVEAPLNPQLDGPPLRGPHGLRSLDAELSDAGVSISEARSTQPQPKSATAFNALTALCVLAGALERGEPEAIQRALSEVESLLQAKPQQPPGGGLDAVAWRAMYRIHPACKGWLYSTFSEGSKAKSRSVRMEAGRLRLACGGT